MAGCQPSQVQRLLPTSQFQISGDRTLDHLAPGRVAGLINGGQRKCVPLLKVAAREAQWARHTLQKYTAISDMKCLVLLIYVLLYSKTSFIIKSINLLWQLFSGKANIILNIYILRAYKISICPYHVTTFWSSVNMTIKIVFYASLTKYKSNSVVLLDHKDILIFIAHARCLDGRSTLWTGNVI